jgi:hypothetical protein
MSGEDYKVQHNGVEMNFSKYVKLKKVGSGNNKFKKLVEKYNLTVIGNNNNVMSFLYKDELYYYALVKHKIRKKGCKDWTENINEVLN